MQSHAPVDELMFSRDSHQDKRENMIACAESSLHRDKKMDSLLLNLGITLEGL